MGFIRFIHRTVTDPQAEEMVERIGKGLVDVLSELVNQADHAKRSHDIARWRRMARGHEPAMIAKAGQGYIQKIDYPGLLNWCAENNCCMQIRIRAGDFVVDGVCAHRVCGSRPEVLNRSVEHRNRYIVTGPVRTSIQDPEYPITQLNQLAARALSPGINAPGTAISCVDSFSLALAEIVDRDMPGCVFLDGESNARLLIRSTGFAGRVKAVYAPLRQFAITDVAAPIRLLESICRLAELTTRTQRLKMLGMQGDLIWDGLEDYGFTDCELRDIRRRYKRLQILAAQFS